MWIDPQLFVVDSSARDPKADLWFAEPAGFSAVPINVLLNEAEGDESDALRTLLAPILNTAPDDLAKRSFLAQVGRARRLLRALCEAGTVYCAIGLHRDDAVGDDDSGSDGASAGSDETADVSVRSAGGADRPLLSFLTLSWRDVAVAPPSVTAARAVVPTEGDAHDRIEYVEDAPCGPVTISETLRRPSAASGFAQIPLLQIHAHLPHPDGRRLAVLSLSTQAVHRRDDYRRILRGSVELISFEDPLATS
ncbi:hypothetical protein ABZ921_37220 [Streptomyces atriruber]|uniref:ESX secretion-associated protein EspG n=1 Tax=Streptomyces atriruber TaxID=545121 RepID=A0ABV3BZ57_9ACTN